MSVPNAKDIYFTGATLSQVPSQYSTMHRAILENATLVDAKLEYSTLSGCNLVGADLTDVQINDRTCFYQCNYDSSTVLPDGFDPVAKGHIALDGLKQWPSYYDKDRH
eukprot:CCRYP_000946-RA/>CCRYP_000946-RA protein AED:0.21 eAED:0.21 QI:0/-1/0/1/-1/1/1/0/107